MRDNFTYTLLSIVRSPALLFWPLLFPIIVSLLFSFAFANVKESPIALGVVADGAYAEAPGLDETLHAFDRGSDTGSGEHVFDLSSYASADEASAAANAGEIDAYVLVTDGEPALRIPLAGLGEEKRLGLTSAVIVLDGFKRARLEVETVAQEDPTLLLGEEGRSALDRLVASGARPSDEQLAEIARSVAEQGAPELVAQFHGDVVRSRRLVLTRTAPDPTARYYYALLGMAAGLGMDIAFEVVFALMATTSAVGARRTLAGMPRWRILASSMAAAWLSAFACLLVGLVFMWQVVGVDFGDRLLACLVALAISSLAFCALGALLATFGLDGVIGTAVTMLLSFFAGLFGTGSQRISDELAVAWPQLAAANPVRQTAQLFYSLLYHESLGPYLRVLATLAAMAAVFATAAALRMRRQRHAQL